MNQSGQACVVDWSGQCSTLGLEFPIAPSLGVQRLLPARLSQSLSIGKMSPVTNRSVQLQVLAPDH